MQRELQAANLDERKRKRMISNCDLLRRVKMKKLHFDARPEVNNLRVGNPMIAMLSHIILWLDMTILLVGKSTDNLIGLIILFGLRLGINIQNELFKILFEPTHPANYLKMSCYCGIVLLLFHYFMSEHKSSIVQRFYGVAALSSVAYHLWTLKSEVSPPYQLCILLCIICLPFLGSVMEDIDLKILLTKLIIWMWLGLINVSLFAFIWKSTGPANYCNSECSSAIAQLIDAVAYLLPIVCHLFILRFALPVSYVLSLLTCIIGLLLEMLCSVGKNAERMNRYFKSSDIKVVFGIHGLFELRRNDPADHFKVICYGVFLILVCCLGLLNYPSISGVVFLSSFGHFLWSFSTSLSNRSRLCFVGVSTLLLAGLATAYENYFKTT